jgi:hypothetical protein
METFSDTQGLVFVTLDAAEHKAVRTAAEMSRDRLPESYAREIISEARDEHGQRVRTVKVAMEIQRQGPSFSLPADGGSTGGFSLLASRR